jgi:hypothetical protein
VSELQKEIGVGPSILLMSTKTILYMLFCLTILNLPVYYLLYTFNDDKDTCQDGTEEHETCSDMDLIAKISLTNLVADSKKAEFLSWFVLFSDIITVSILILFVHLLSKSQEEYNDQATKETVQMSNFVVRLENMPNDREFGGEYLQLKAELWA